MTNNMFTVSGNICGDRIRIARMLQNPPINQEELATKLNVIGLNNMNKAIISRIEKNQRHVIDAELRAIAQVLGITMDWLVGNANVQDIFKTVQR